MAFTIQESTPADHAAIASIYNTYIERGGSTMDEVIKVAADIAAWVKKFNDREELHVIKDGSTVVGWGIIKRYSDRHGYRFTCETAVYLHHDYLGQGLGSSMKKYLIERCKSMDYHHLVAKIFASNEASIIYNERLGYEIIGRQKEVGFKNGKWVDVVIMGLLI